MADKKFFKVACSWEVYATMDIEAESLDEAMDIAQFDSPLPNEPSDTFGEEDWSWILPDGESIEDALAIYDNFSIEGLHPEDDDER